MSYTNENKSYTERVQCPYCREVIKAPNQPDVTFLCPNCGRELITYDKEEEVPQNIKKWNWGAFFLTWIWGVMNGVYWPLITIPFGFLFVVTDSLFIVDFLWCVISIGMGIALGFNGNKWAWKAKYWRSTADFLRVQRKWTIAALWVVAIGFIITVICTLFFDFSNLH